MKRTNALALLVALTATTTQAGIFNHIFKYKGFKFDNEKKICINKKGKRGLSKNYYGPCGDLTGFDSKKLVKKINRGHVAKDSLIGAKVIGLNLSGAKIATVDLSYADLRGTNLRNTELGEFFGHVNRLKMIGARYDETTRLPFSDFTAISVLGMVKLDYKSITSIYPEPMDIFKETNYDEVSEKLKSISSLTQRYHQELLDLVNRVPEISYDQLRMILDSTYVSAVDYKELKKQLDYTKGNAEIQRINDLLFTYLNLGVGVNSIISTAIPKLKTDENLDRVLELLNDYFPTDNDELIHNDFTLISQMYEEQLSDTAYLKVIEVLDHTASANKDLAPLKEAVSSFMDRDGKLVVSQIPNVLNYINNHKEEVFELLFSKFKSFTTKEYISLIKGFDFYDSFYENRNKISDLTFSNSLELAKLFYGGKRDKIIYEGIEKRGYVTVNELTTVIYDLSYDLYDITVASYDLITGNSYSISHELAASRRNRFSDVILIHYYAKMKKEITISDYLELEINLNSLSFFVSNTAEYATGLNLMNVIEFSNKINTHANKSIVKRFFELVGTLTTDETLLLYEKTSFDLEDLTKNLSKISNLDFKNAVKMARHFKNNASDTIINYFANKTLNKTGITVRDLILLADVSYNATTAIIKDNLQYIKDWNVINASVLMSNSPRGIKNHVGEYYLTNIAKKASLSYDEMIKVLNAGYNYYGGANQLFLNNLDKIKGFDFDMMVKIAKDYSRDNRDKVITHYLENETNLKTVDLRDAAMLSFSNKYSYIKNNFEKTIDQSASNTKILADVLYRGQKDVITKLYLDSVSKITSGDLITVISSAYSEYNELAISNVSKVTDLSVSNAILIKDQLYRYNKDHFLMKSLNYLTDLSVNNIYDYASSAYSSSGRDEILKTGLKVLGQE